MGNRRYHIWANSGGCPQNQLDGSHAAAWLEQAGFLWTNSIEESDVVLINSCAYHSEKETESVQKTLEIDKQLSGRGIVVLSGCLPKIAPEKCKQYFPDNIIIPATDIEHLSNFFPLDGKSWDQFRPNQIAEPFFKYEKPFRRLIARHLTNLRKHLDRDKRNHLDRLLMYDHSPDSYVVRIAEGCLGACTYCAIRFSRGKLKSRPMDKIINEVKKGVDSGHDEILLTATELSAWGRDNGDDITTLLKKIFEIPGNFDLLLFYAHPRWLIERLDKLIPLLAAGRIKFIHLALNGGSDRVLNGMRRGYSLTEFRHLAKSIRRVSPGTVLQTQVITGFPGETWFDFVTTLRFFAENYFNNVQVHAFNPRPGTVAASLDGQVNVKIRQLRQGLLYTFTLCQKCIWNAAYMIRVLIKSLLSLKASYPINRNADNQLSNLRGDSS
ncbi:radical SAM protein [bacterium]|nr:radical SAM protein [bacterium]